MLRKLSDEQKQKARERAKKWYHDNREAQLPKLREYYEANKEKWAEYRENNREQVRENNRRARAKDPERWKKYNREYSKKRVVRIKDEIIAAYGGCCTCCGEGHREFLTIDHVGGGGAEHRKIGLTGKYFYEWLRSQGFPKDKYRLLCSNCNLSIGIYGYCPHKI